MLVRHLCLDMCLTCRRHSCALLNAASEVRTSIPPDQRFPGHHLHSVVSMGADSFTQLYVDGEFVGGADILNEMAEKGELKPLLQVRK